MRIAGVTVEHLHFTMVWQLGKNCADCSGEIRTFAVYSGMVFWGRIVRIALVKVEHLHFTVVGHVEKNCADCKGEGRTCAFYSGRAFG